MNLLDNQKRSLACFGVIFLVFLLLNCSMSTREKNAGSSYKETDEGPDNVIGGSFTAGGGGVFEAELVEQEVLSEFIKRIRSDLHLFLNFLSHHNTDSDATESENNKNWINLFTDDLENTRVVLDQVSISDSRQKPCSFLGHETDGSFETGAGICISSFRLKHKLNEIDYYPQLLALAVHELAHALGAKETLALQIQKETLSLFKDTTSQTVVNTVSDNSKLAEMTLAIFESSDFADLLKRYKDNPTPVPWKIPSAPLAFIGEDHLPLLGNFIAYAINIRMAISADEDLRSSAAMDSSPANLLGKKLFQNSNLVSCRILHQEIFIDDKTFQPSNSCNLSMIFSEQGGWSKSQFQKEIGNLERSFNTLISAWLRSSDRKIDLSFFENTKPSTSDISEAIKSSLNP